MHWFWNGLHIEFTIEFHNVMFLGYIYIYWCFYTILNLVQLFTIDIDTYLLMKYFDSSNLKKIFCCKISLWYKRYKSGNVFVIARRFEVYDLSIGQIYMICDIQLLFTIEIEYWKLKFREYIIPNQDLLNSFSLHFLLKNISIWEIGKFFVVEWNIYEMLLLLKFEGINKVE